MEIIILGISTISDYTITSTVVCKGYKYFSVSEVFNVSLLFKFHVSANKKFGVNSDIISTEDVLLLCYILYVNIYIKIPTILKFASSVFVVK